MHAPLAASDVYSGGLRVGSMPFHETPVFKGCLRKYYVQTFYLHYAYTGATHFSFNSSNNARVSTPVPRIRCAHVMCYVHVNTTISKWKP